MTAPRSRGTVSAVARSSAAGRSSTSTRSSTSREKGTPRRSLSSPSPASACSERSIRRGFTLRKSSPSGIRLAASSTQVQEKRSKLRSSCSDSAAGKDLGGELGLPVPSLRPQEALVARRARPSSGRRAAGTRRRTLRSSADRPARAPAPRAARGAATAGGSSRPTWSAACPPARRGRGRRAARGRSRARRGRPRGCARRGGGGRVRTWGRGPSFGHRRRRRRARPRGRRGERKPPAPSASDPVGQGPGRPERFRMLSLIRLYVLEARWERFSVPFVPAEPRLE